MTNTVSGAVTAAPALPPLDTPEARWAYLLTMWRSHGLPTPESMAVGEANEIGSVWLPNHERAQVDQWIAALGGKSATLNKPTRPDGTPSRNVSYGTFVDGFHIACWLDLTADADEHGWQPDRPELVAAAGVAEMLVAEPNPVCNKPLGVEQYCARDAGHDGDCDPAAARGPKLAGGWRNGDGTIGLACVCEVTFDGFDPKDAATLDRLFANHECNTLPAPCGFIGGCTYGPDAAPAPAEPDGHHLCTQHRAEIFPELAGGGR